MDSKHVSHDEFFSKLEELFTHQKGSDHGAVYLSQKRLTHGQDSPSTVSGDPFPDLHPNKPLPLVIRASNGKSKRDRSGKVNLATLVEPHDLESFYTRYADVCKGGMTALKPRDRSKKKAKAKKKKTTA